MIYIIIILLSFSYIFVASNNLIFKESKDVFASYGEIIEEVVENCDDQLDVIFIYESSSTINKYLQSAKLTKPRLILYGDTQEAFNFTNPTRIDAFFLTINDNSEFTSLIKYLKKVAYWKPSSKFYIFSTQKACHKPLSFMEKFGWKQFEVLNFHCVCLNQSTSTIFTYNPYAYYAPLPWKIIKPTNGNLRFYQRTYAREHLCHGLNFDRTKYLNQVEVQYLGFFNPSKMPYFTKWIANTKYKVQEDVFRLPVNNALAAYHPKPLISILNRLLNIRLASLYVSLDTPFAKRIKHAEMYKPHLILSDIFFIFSEYEHSFPTAYRRYTILSHNPGYWTLFELIYFLFGKWMITFICGLCSLTFFVCWYTSKKDRVMFAFFEIIRLLISVSIRTAMDTMPLKMYFSLVFLFFLIIQSIFQSKLATFLTNPGQKSVANTLEDLKSPVYSTIVGGDELSRITNEVDLYSKLKHIYSASDRKNTIANNKSVVLFGEANSLMHFLLENNLLDLYFAKQPVINEPLCYLLHKYSPLKDRINKALMTLWEIGISDYFMVKGFSISLMLLEKRKVLSELKRIRQPINLNSLIPLFIFLGVGILIATICFFIELIIGRKKKTRIDNKID